MSVIIVLIYLVSPLLVIYSCHKFRFLNKLGVVVVAYMLGVLIGNSGLLPPDSSRIQQLLTSITIPLAIPLMLFSTNPRDVFKLAGKSLISLVIGVVSVVLLVVSGYFIFRDSIPDAWKVSGMLVGVYTGGTPNLASLKLILDVDETLYLVTHSADMLLGVFYLFFIISVGQRFLNRFLKPAGNVLPLDTGTSHIDPYHGIFQKRFVIPLLKALMLSLIVAVVSVLVSLAVPRSAQMAVVMLMITTISLALSFVPSVNKVPRTFDLGMYIILVFSVVVASMANITALVPGTLEVLYYVAWVVFGSLLLQVLLSRLLKIDTDTVIITSTALICSPPFVPVVAGALKNRAMILPGLTIGIIGYAIGNYIGFILAQILK